MKLWIALTGTLALATSMSALAQSSTDAGVGTWILNVAKSKFEPGPAPKSETRIYEDTPDGIRMTLHVETADGASHTETTTYKTDGKPYSASGNPNLDTVKVKRVSRWEVRATQLRSGKVVGTLTRTTSRDGKTMTVASEVTDPSGRSEHDVRVYDRQ